MHGLCGTGSSLLRSNLKYFFVDCLIFRSCLAFVYPDFSVQIPCCIALFLSLFGLGYVLDWWFTVFCGGLRFSGIPWASRSRVSKKRRAVQCPFIVSECRGFR